MSPSDRRLQAELVAFAELRTGSTLEATAALLAAASATLSDAIGQHEAGETILAVVAEAVGNARH